MSNVIPSEVQAYKLYSDLYLDAKRPESRLETPGLFSLESPGRVSAKRQSTDVALGSGDPQSELVPYKGATGERSSRAPWRGLNLFGRHPDTGQKNPRLPVPLHGAAKLGRLVLPLLKTKSAGKLDDEGLTEFDPPAATAVLKGLQNANLGHAEHRLLIIQAEASRFTNAQLPIIQPILRDFILQFRNSSDRIDQIAVGAAIRKFVASMQISELPTVGFLLEAGSRFAPSIAVELEVAKMIVRKLTANPVNSHDAYLDLAVKLSELAGTYLSDRLLSREKHGATALNAVLALALLRSSRLNECLHRVDQLDSQWFIDHLAHRAREISQELSARFDESTIATQLANLSLLSVAVSAP